MTQIGYNPKFINEDIVVPLPGLSPKLAGAAYTHESLPESMLLNYAHYTVVMNKETRQLIYSASNINQNQKQSIPRDESRDWDIDSRIPVNHQLDNRFYSSNDWDRGHMVQRDNNNWGRDAREAIIANDDTFFYTNAAFQHKYFNQDEWLKLETLFGNWEEDTNGMLCVFTGPVHLTFDRQYARSWHDTVRIPSGFFKVICYQSKQTNRLETRAFLLYQDNDFIGNKKSGSSSILLKNYQVTIKEIEELTGLNFDDVIAASNPLFYSGTDERINNYPERIPLDFSDDLVNSAEQDRATQEVRPEDKDIVIASAMVNPEGRDKPEMEWVSLMNLSEKTRTLDGWTLLNQDKKSIDLTGKIIDPGIGIKVPMSEGDMRLINAGGTIILKNENSEIVDRAYYTAGEVKTQGRAIRF